MSLLPELFALPRTNDWLLGPAADTWFFGATRLVGSRLRGCATFCYASFVMRCWTSSVLLVAGFLTASL